MLKRTLSLIALLIAPLLTQELNSQVNDEFFQRLYNFARPFDAFVRRYAGCPDEGFDLAMCHQSQGTWDVKHWNEARKAAMKLFDLQDKP